MERPAKRPRLLTPLDSVYNASFGTQHAYYENSVDGFNDYEEVEVEDDGPVYDPDADLVRRRARVDFKLKSTFEAIFEKYGKDFEGIGDEIDTRTGEIVVNNGHLLGMRHEMDAGDVSDSEDDFDDDTLGSEEDEDDVMEDQGSNEDDHDNQADDNDNDLEEDDEENYDEEVLSDGDMEEDDMILRGFVQASQQFMHRQRPHNPEPSNDRLLVQAEDPYEDASRLSLPKSLLPSRSEILAQFGPQLGPEIVKIVLKNDSLGDSRIEPAWRVPEITPDVPSPPGRRPLIRSILRQAKPEPKPEPEPEPERSPSPENAPSIWAITAPISRRKRFSAAEDEMLLDYATEKRRQGLSLSSHLTWKQLEAMAPHHDWRAWKSRYMRRFTYLYPGPQDESELSTSETSASTGQMYDKQLGSSTLKNMGHMQDEQPDFSSGFAQPVPPRSSHPIDAQRPSRTRKPAQRDGIVSWSEAVATIASIDPVGNAGLLDDARRAADYSAGSRHTMFPVSRVFSTSHQSQGERTSNIRQTLGQDTHSRNLSGIDRHDPSNSVGNELALDKSTSHNGINTTESVSCPHVDCRPYPTTLYRLERRYDEELSPLYSHLLCVHRIAPFPCVEPECERKGIRGYFMQSDLVRHVKGMHPYVAALHRLRGRVDPDLLDSKSQEQLHDSTQNHRLAISGQQHRDCGFKLAQPSFGNHERSDARRSHLASSRTDLEVNLGSRAERVATDGSLKHVHTSSASIKVPPSKAIFRASSSESDVQMLDENPFLRDASQPEQRNNPGLSAEVAGGEKGTLRLQGPTPISPPSLKSAIPCTYPGCQMIISHIVDMAAHLRTHGRRSASPISSKQSDLMSKPPLSTSIPNSQSSESAIQSSLAILSTTNGHSSNIREVPNPPVAVAQSFVDRSYEFSDEEDGIRPVLKKPPPQLARIRNLPQVPQSFFAPSPRVKSPQSETQPSQPSTSKNGASPKIKSPQSTTLSSPSSTLTQKPLSPEVKPPQSPVLQTNSSTAIKTCPSSRSDQPLTPATKFGPRRLILGNVLDSEDFDELSMNENGFVLLSVRPRKTPLPIAASRIRVKSEQSEDQSAFISTISTRKRKFRTLQAADDEIDELGQSGPPMLNPYRLGPFASLKPRRKTTNGEPSLPSTRPVKLSKARDALRSGFNLQPDPSTHITPSHTPTKPSQLTTRTSTPLLDLVKRGETKQNGPNNANVEVPSTSEMGSSPNTHGTRTQEERNDGPRSLGFQVLVTPYKKAWATRMVKDEDVDGVVTPGGTLRRCGQDGFECGRAFCFQCGSEEGNTA